MLRLRLDLLFAVAVVLYQPTGEDLNGLDLFRRGAHPFAADEVRQVLTGGIMARGGTAGRNPAARGVVSRICHLALLLPGRAGCLRPLRNCIRVQSPAQAAWPSRQRSVRGLSPGAAALC